MRILTDFPRFPVRWESAGVQGTASAALDKAAPRDLLRLLPEIRRADMIIVHEGDEMLLALALLFWILPFLKKPIVSVDLILRRPMTFKQRLLAAVKKTLLGRVDHFIHYFRDLDGYEKYFGVASARSSYVPFKSNVLGNPLVAELASEQAEDYIYSAGQSLRDFDTFFDAVSLVDYPAAIPRPDFGRLRHHGARFTRRIEDLPRNVTLLPDGGSQADWIRNFLKAKIVVIPVVRDTLCASGIGTYLDAMILGKCVVISAGPGVSDVLTDQAIIVPPEDPAALAAAIKKVWENEALRRETAERGRRYALGLGAEPELLRRILDRAVEGLPS